MIPASLYPPGDLVLTQQPAKSLRTGVYQLHVSTGCHTKHEQKLEQIANNRYERKILTSCMNAFRSVNASCGFTKRRASPPARNS